MSLIEFTGLLIVFVLFCTLFELERIRRAVEVLRSSEAARVGG